MYQWEKRESPEINPHTMVNQFVTKEARLHNGEKTVSVINAAGKTEELHTKIYEEHPLTVYTKTGRLNGFKLITLSKCKTRQYKALRGRHRQNRL